ncbi:MAG: sugar phosphate isomerase/epimerase [Clostridiales bacterium]|nr:sugar phosphate isomerase/epimerase [Clostridiales bacterium]
MYNLDIGVIIPLENLLENGVQELKDLGLNACQLNGWNSEYFTEENAKKIKTMIAEHDIRISSLWVGWPGPRIWDFIDGPSTLGLVPKEFRFERMEALKKGADFAKLIGITDITTHVGFIPENPSTTEYMETVMIIRDVAQYCKKLGLYFNFETGQETPITLLRTIQDIGLDNLGINLDPANLLMYGKGNPQDAVDMYGDYIRGVHVKDGLYPTDGRRLGKETPVGEGMVDFPVLIQKLKEHNYNGALIIEREISGPQQKEDILKAKALLEDILEKL